MYNLKFTVHVFYGQTHTIKIFLTLSSYRTALTLFQRKIDNINVFRKSVWYFNKRFTLESVMYFSISGITLAYFNIIIQI